MNQIPSGHRNIPSLFPCMRSSRERAVQANTPIRAINSSSYHQVIPVRQIPDTVDIKKALRDLFAGRYREQTFNQIGPLAIRGQISSLGLREDLLTTFINAVFQNYDSEAWRSIIQNLPAMLEGISDKLQVRLVHKLAGDNFISVCLPKDLKEEAIPFLHAFTTKEALKALAVAVRNQKFGTSEEVYHALSAKIGIFSTQDSQCQFFIGLGEHCFGHSKTVLALVVQNLPKLIFENANLFVQVVCDYGCLGKSILVMDALINWLKDQDDRCAIPIGLKLLEKNMITQTPEQQKDVIETLISKINTKGLYTEKIQLQRLITANVFKAHQALKDHVILDSYPDYQKQFVQNVVDKKFGDDVESTKTMLTKIIEYTKLEGHLLCDEAQVILAKAIQEGTLLDGNSELIQLCLNHLEMFTVQKAQDYILNAIAERKMGQPQQLVTSETLKVFLRIAKTNDPSVYVRMFENQVIEGQNSFLKFAKITLIPKMITQKSQTDWVRFLLQNPISKQYFSQPSEGIVYLQQFTQLGQNKELQKMLMMGFETGAWGENCDQQVGIIRKAFIFINDEEALNSFERAINGKKYDDSRLAIAVCDYLPTLSQGLKTALILKIDSVWSHIKNVDLRKAIARQLEVFDNKIEVQIVWEMINRDQFLEGPFSTEDKQNILNEILKHGTSLFFKSGSDEIYKAFIDKLFSKWILNQEYLPIVKSQWPKRMTLSVEQYFIQKFFSTLKQLKGGESELNIRLQILKSLPTYLFEHTEKKAFHLLFQTNFLQNDDERLALLSQLSMFKSEYAQQAISLTLDYENDVFLSKLNPRYHHEALFLLIEYACQMTHETSRRDFFSTLFSGQFENLDLDERVKIIESISLKNGNDQAYALKKIEQGVLGIESEIRTALVKKYKQFYTQDAQLEIRSHLSKDWFALDPHMILTFFRHLPVVINDELQFGCVDLMDQPVFGRVHNQHLFENAWFFSNVMARQKVVDRLLLTIQNATREEEIEFLAMYIKSYPHEGWSVVNKLQEIKKSIQNKTLKILQIREALDNSGMTLETLKNVHKEIEEGLGREIKLLESAYKSIVLNLSEKLSSSIQDALGQLFKEDVEAVRGDFVEIWINKAQLFSSKESAMFISEIFFKSSFCDDVGLLRRFAPYARPDLRAGFKVARFLDHYANTVGIPPNEQKLWDDLMDNIAQLPLEQIQHAIDYIRSRNWTEPEKQSLIKNFFSEKGTLKKGDEPRIGSFNSTQSLKETLLKEYPDSNLDAYFDGLATCSYVIKNNLLVVYSSPKEFSLSTYMGRQEFFEKIRVFDLNHNTSISGLDLTEEHSFFEYLPGCLKSLLIKDRFSIESYQHVEVLELVFDLIIKSLERGVDNHDDQLTLKQLKGITQSIVRAKGNGGGLGLPADVTVQLKNKIDLFLIEKNQDLLLTGPVIEKWKMLPSLKKKAMASYLFLVLSQKGNLGYHITREGRDLNSANSVFYTLAHEMFKLLERENLQQNGGLIFQRSDQHEDRNVLRELEYGQCAEQVALFFLRKNTFVREVFE